MASAFSPSVAQGVPVQEIVGTVANAPLVGEVLKTLSGEAPKMLSGADATAILRQQDCQWLSGLSTAVAESVAWHPLRVVIMDNSGSMRAGDGTACKFHAGTYHAVGCTRWQELSADIVAIAKMADALGARTDFHLLNPVPGFAGVSISTSAWDGGIAPHGPTVATAELEGRLDRVRPNGSTPLTDAVMKVVEMVRPQAGRLRAAGQAVAVLICTDGLPNDKSSFVQAMRQLQTLPVWCVVRLCTNDGSVVDFWNELDKALEAPLEVLDDVRGEAKEVGARNPWLTYAPPLYHARLFGLPEKLFDVLDEHAMAPSQIRELLSMLLGVRDLPQPELDQAAFLESVRVALQAQPPAYDPKSGKMKPWVDLAALERAIRPRIRCGQRRSASGAACAIM